MRKEFILFLFLIIKRKKYETPQEYINVSYRIFIFQRIERKREKKMHKTYRIIYAHSWEVVCIYISIHVCKNIHNSHEIVKIIKKEITLLELFNSRIRKGSRKWWFYVLHDICHHWVYRAFTIPWRFRIYDTFVSANRVAPRVKKI